MRTAHMPDAICDSSTLIHLAGIGRLDLLCSYHQNILIPPAVWTEVVSLGRDRTGVQEVTDAHHTGWIRVVAPKNRILVHGFLGAVHAGEAEAIVLAIERQPSVIFLDDGDARRHATRYGLKISGVIGILIRAKNDGVIPSLKTELDTLRTVGHMWIHDGIYHEALRRVGEK